MNPKVRKNHGPEFKDGTNSKAWNSISDENKLNHRFQSAQSDITVLTCKPSKDQSLKLVPWVGKGLGFCKCLLWELLTTRVDPHLLQLLETSNPAWRSHQSPY